MSYILSVFVWTPVVQCLSSVRYATNNLLFWFHKHTRVLVLKKRSKIKLWPNTNTVNQTTCVYAIVPLHIVIITSSNQFGAKRNGCSWWEFDWRRWERTPFEFSEQCLSKFLALVLHDMSCRMPKDCWGNRFLEEDGNCELYFCRRSNRPLVWGTWHSKPA